MNTIDDILKRIRKVGADGGHNDESEADTLKDARAKAKRMMSDTYTRMVESTVPVRYVEVVNAKTGEVVIDFGRSI